MYKTIENFIESFIGFGLKIVIIFIFYTSCYLGNNK